MVGFKCNRDFSKLSNITDVLFYFLLKVGVQYSPELAKAEGIRAVPFSNIQLLQKWHQGEKDDQP